MSGLASLTFLIASVLIPAGRPSPPLVARTMTGDVWRERLTGQVTIVEFSATWCPHCRQSLAGYRALLAARPVRLIVVDVDEDPTAVMEFFARHPLPRGAQLLIDLEEHARRTWGVTEFPAVYLIDRDGIIRDSFAGWDDEGGIRYLIREIDALGARHPARPTEARQPVPGDRRRASKKAASRARPAAYVRAR
jgi:thiol-disulfide isomerase/thioredoxin